MPADDWMPIRKAAHRVGRGLSTVYRWIEEDRVRVMRVHRKTFVFVPDLIDTAARPTGRPRTET